MPGRRARSAVMALLTLLSGGVFRCVISEAADQPPPAGDAEVRSLIEYRREARACWDDLVTVDNQSTRLPELAQAAVDRMLGTSHGLDLVTSLHERFADPASGALRATITVRFVDHRFKGRDSTNGTFHPLAAGAGEYEIVVRTRSQRGLSDPTLFVFGEYPDNTDCSFVYFYQEPESAMAQTLYHELLHVWFVNSFEGERRRFPSGHGMVRRCEFEEDFLDLLSAHATELSMIEGYRPPRIRKIPSRRSSDSDRGVSPRGSTMPPPGDTGSSR